MELPKTNLSIYNNSEYRPGSKIKVLFWIIINAVFFNNPFAVVNSLKIFFLKIFGAEIGYNVLIKPSVSIKYPWFLIVGNNVWIGEGVWIDNLTKVTIGNNVCVSQGAFLLCGNHNYKKPSFDLLLGEILLEEGVWVGAKSIVCPGITCKSHSILTIGSVANKDLDPYSIYQGNPAVKIRERTIT